MKKAERFLKVSDLSNIRTICSDFSHFLLQRENIEKNIVDNPNFQNGLEFGIKSTLILFNDFIIKKDGAIDKEMIERILEGIKNKHKDVGNL